MSDFASVKNTVIDSAHKGYGTELADICKTIDEQRMMNSDILREFFWNTFIVDAFIGNWDRHNGNWGFLYNELDDTNTLAPIYDCGSSLYPQADEDIMKKVLSDKQELRARVFDAPTSALTQNGKRINYFKFISSLENEDCNAALRRMVPQIDMSKINKIIDEIPCISDLQKRFYKTMLAERKEKILDYSLKKLKTISVDKDFSERGENNATLNNQDKKHREAIREIFGDSQLITNPNISQSADDFLTQDSSPVSQKFDDIGDDER